MTMGSMHERFYIDISDTFEEKTGVKKPVFETDYHTRILDYLNDHRDLDVIKKIKRLEKLTDADIRPQETCAAEGTKVSEEAKIEVLHLASEEV